ASGRRREGRDMALRVARVWRSWALRGRRSMAVSDTPALIVITLVTILLTLMGLLLPNIPAAGMVLPMVLGSLFLGPRLLPWFIVFAGACYCVLLFSQKDISHTDIGRAFVVLAVALLLMLTSFRRSRLGVS